MMEKSLRKFHTEEELPLLKITGEDLQKRIATDPFFFYRATPVIASELKDYDVVIKIDADSFITGDISDAWKVDSDVCVVLNSNPKEQTVFPYTIWDIPMPEYVNCGFVVMKNKKFIEHWKKLCFSPRFNNYQMREQDFLNILCHYGDYDVELLDGGDSFWGLSSKGYWQYITVAKDKLILNPTDDGYPPVSKYIKVIHWAGGNEPQKMNYRTRFNEKAVKYIDKLLK
jgi:hypothetical protein